MLTPQKPLSTTEVIIAISFSLYPVFEPTHCFEDRLLLDGNSTNPKRFGIQFPTAAGETDASGYEDH
jgi:hypothetical protein